MVWSFLRRSIAGFGLFVVMTAPVFAATVVPAPADVSHIKPETAFPQNHSADVDVAVPSAPSSTPVPAMAKDVHFVLQHVEIEGVTVFEAQELEDLYAPFIRQDVTLETIYKMADTLTARYRRAGYFLSLARVPNQRIRDGSVTIKVTEGYIGFVDLPEDLRGSAVGEAYAARLTQQRPIQAETVESVLLRFSDLPGFSYRAVASPLEGQDDGAVKLTLLAIPKDAKATLSFDNYASRYLGPHEVSASYSTSFLPLQQTTVSGLTAVPDSDLHYGMLDHKAVIAPDLTLDVNGGVVKAYPGYTLESFEIDSQSATAGIGLAYQWIRQRQDNLGFRLQLAGSDVTSDLLGSPLLRDRIRVLRAGADYDGYDGWGGYNTANFMVSQGLPIFGASRKGDANLSRAGALPYFTKTELSLSRLQELDEDWSLFAAASGQLASGVLYASEQFGYGGPVFGRAFDAADISGDEGVSGSFELRYLGWSSDAERVRVQPYCFWDIGTAWAGTVGSVQHQTGASSGFGVRVATGWKQTAHVGVAWPIGRLLGAPTYTALPEGPRFLLQISQDF